jgi:hypothetical protein
VPVFRAIASLLAVAMLVAACAGPGGTGTPTAGSSTPSGTAPCPTAPEPASDLPGWGVPATKPSITPVLINPAAELVCGANRVLFTIFGEGDAPIGAPNRTAKASFFNLGRDPSNAFATVDGTFVWAIENERGIYVATVTFPEAGVYGMELTTAAAGTAAETQRLVFDVQPSSPVIKVGDKAPASKTPTLADVGGDATKISTDQHPVPALYETSVDKAIADHKAFVLVFATPKFCKSQQCGPTLERLKPFITKYPTLTFINVEPYKLQLVDGTLEPVVDAQNYPVSAPATDEWHLLTEPNVFVVDGDGTVTANFELIFSDAELTAALDAVK